MSRVLRALVLAPFLASGPALGAERSLVLDPAATEIRFALGATLHTARGTARLTRGEIRFDPETGAASGAIVVDATSLDTRNETRDANMHRDVLESAKYPTIAFRPERLEVEQRDETTARVQLHGRMDIHGASHPFVVPAQLSAEGSRLRIRASFRVPYVEWGMRDYSNFLLRVEPFVDVELVAEGVLGDG